MALTDIFLNQLIQFYPNNAINLHHLTTHSTTVLTYQPYKIAIVLWPQICDIISPYLCRLMTLKTSADMLLPSGSPAVHPSAAWRDVTARLVSAFVLSRLDYCNAVLAGLPALTLAPFQRVLHATARLVLNLRPRDHVSAALRELHWLPVAQRIDCKLCLLVHKSSHGQAPEYISNMLKAAADDPSLTTLRTAANGNYVFWRPAFSKGPTTDIHIIISIAILSVLCAIGLYLYRRRRNTNDCLHLHIHLHLHFNLKNYLKYLHGIVRQWSCACDTVSDKHTS